MAHRIIIEKDVNIRCVQCNNNNNFWDVKISVHFGLVCRVRHSTQINSNCYLCNVSRSRGK